MVISFSLHLHIPATAEALEIKWILMYISQPKCIKVSNFSIILFYLIRFDSTRLIYVRVHTPNTHQRRARDRWILYDSAHQPTQTHTHTHTHPLSLSIQQSQIRQLCQITVSYHSKGSLPRLSTYQTAIFTPSFHLHLHSNLKANKTFFFIAADFCCGKNSFILLPLNLLDHVLFVWISRIIVRSSTCCLLGIINWLAFCLNYAKLSDELFGFW